MVGREGFEPPKAEPPDLQSGPIGHSGISPTLEGPEIAVRLPQEARPALAPPTTRCLVLTQRDCLRRDGAARGCSLIHLPLFSL